MAATPSSGPPLGHDYYDIDSIMADEVLVPCQLAHGCTGVGAVVDPSAGGADLPPGSKVDMPLWMVPTMARRGLARAALPVFYGDRMRRKIKAGAGCEDLRVRCAYWYTAAARVHAAMEAAGAGDDTFPPFVLSTFVGRYRDLLTRAPVIESNAQASATQAKLTNEELRLFNAAAEAAAAHDRYRSNREGGAGVGAGGKRKWGGAAGGRGGGGGGGGQENKGP
jgi:GINS complex subunit 3